MVKQQVTRDIYICQSKNRGPKRLSSRSRVRDSALAASRAAFAAGQASISQPVFWDLMRAFQEAMDEETLESWRLQQVSSAILCLEQSWTMKDSSETCKSTQKTSLQNRFLHVSNLVFHGFPFFSHHYDPFPAFRRPLAWTQRPRRRPVSAAARWRQSWKFPGDLERLRSPKHLGWEVPGRLWFLLIIQLGRFLWFIKRLVICDMGGFFLQAMAVFCGHFSTSKRYDDMIHWNLFHVCLFLLETNHMTYLILFI